MAALPPNRPNYDVRVAIGLFVVALILVLALAGCGGTDKLGTTFGTQPATVERVDLYDDEIGLTYGDACDTLLIEDACEALYGATFYSLGQKGYGKKKTTYAKVKAVYVKKNARQISAYKTKAAENARKAQEAAKKAQAAAASKPKSSGSSFKSSSSSSRSSGRR